MSGWSDLVSTGIRVVPFDGAPPRSPSRRAQFSSTFTKTTRLLRRELAMLDAKKLVVELVIRDQDIRVDGFPRANARTPESPAVRVTFESRHGPVRMETAEFATWQDNLRAIALSLEALRAVDRYGVSKRGEQYRGWKAIEARSGSVEDLIPDVAAARAYLDENYGGDLRRALFDSHPDRGGSADDFHKVARAKALLEG